MTTSKCFKSLAKFALLITVLMAGASTQAQAQCEQRLVLQKGESAKIACPQGLSPILQGDVVQCGRKCKLEIVNILTLGGCDQGGCWNHATSFKVTLSGNKSEPALFRGTFDIAQKASIVEKLKADFSDSCTLFQESERDE